MSRTIIILALMVLAVLGCRLLTPIPTPSNTTLPRPTTSAPTPIPRPVSSALLLKDFTAKYKGWTLIGLGCNSNFDIYGKEPREPGTYPVFIYTVGTFGDYKGPEAQTFVDAMAGRGFVAATVEYGNKTRIVSTLEEKAQCIYDSTSDRSAVSAICSNPKADCRKGILTSGLSQGAVMAILARNYDSRVRATYALGVGDVIARVKMALPSDTGDGNRALPTERLRIVNGEHNSGAEVGPGWTRAQLEAITSLSCGPSAYSCFRENGSGWYMVRDSEVVDGLADHCYFHGDGKCSNNPSFEPGWLSSAGQTWSLNVNLDWLTSFAD